MGDAKQTFQEMHGCSGCKHSCHKDPEGKDPQVHGKHFWCEALAKAVDAQDGKTCDRFAT